MCLQKYYFNQRINLLTPNFAEPLNVHGADFFVNDCGLCCDAKAAGTRITEFESVSLSLTTHPRLIIDYR